MIITPDGRFAPGPLPEGMQLDRPDAVPQEMWEEAERRFKENYPEMWEESQKRYKELIDKWHEGNP